ncbi:MAG: winged helix-turn-helix domain-containing protein [Candidatus Nitrosopolaris sp.]
MANSEYDFVWYLVCPLLIFYIESLDSYCLTKFNQLREYLALLVENDLIQYEGGQTYRTTEKGMRVLRLQNEIDEVAPISFVKE